MIKKLYYKRQNNKFLNKSKLQAERIKNVYHSYLNESDEKIKEDFKTFNSIGGETRLLNCFGLGMVVIKKITGLTLHDVQLQSALNLYDGNLSEQKTGEGKSLTSVLPILMRATEGQVHVCTVNEYLSKRDKELFEPIFNFFGLTVALNLQGDPKPLKKKHYEADIIYGTGSTFGFDYLYDNMVQYLDEKMCSPEKRYFALVDEVDLILIDEARTPLIVGAPFSGDISLIKRVDKAVKKLDKIDYTVEEDKHAVYLTKSGEDKLMDLLKVDLFSKENIEVMHLVHQSLLANFFYKLNVDYGIIHHRGEDKVVIIDAYTGRIQPDRRFSNGLHQALEAKHSDAVRIQDETRTTATITLQNYFRLYKHLSGMSGTVHQERDEFKKVYNLNIIEIPTNKPMLREDKDPIMEVEKSTKWETVIKKIKEYHSLEYPILVGTSSVEDSEIISSLLGDLPHVVLNAKQDKNEADIIALAGKKGAITVATNMAGRGTDIIPESDEHPLVVIVTELNESSRIDAQLKGRTSRQGAFGITETILSTEDAIFKKANMTKPLAKVRKELSATSKFISRITRMLQSELEGSHSLARENALKYDDIIKEHRNLFYSKRDEVLRTFDLEGLVAILKKLNLEQEKIDELEERNFFKDLTTLQHFILYAMDRAWVNHIDKLDRVKSAIGWRSQSGHNPIILYQNEAQLLYNELKVNIKEFMREALSEMKKTDIKKANAYNGERGEN